MNVADDKDAQSRPTGATLLKDRGSNFGDAELYTAGLVVLHRFVGAPQPSFSGGVAGIKDKRGLECVHRALVIAGIHLAVAEGDHGARAQLARVHGSSSWSWSWRSCRSGLLVRLRGRRLGSVDRSFELGDGLRVHHNLVLYAFDSDRILHDAVGAIGIGLRGDETGK